MLRSSRVAATRVSRARSGVFPEGFVKIDLIPERLRIEVIKSTAGLRVARASGLFEVPEVLHVTETRSTSQTVEEVDSLGTVLHQMRADIASKIELATRVGHVLGEVHANLELPADVHSVLSKPYSGPDRVPIHGDYCLGNILRRRGDGKVVVVDWSAPAWLGEWGTHGSSAWDVGVFLCSLFYQRPRDPMAITQALPIAKAFVRGYRHVRAFDIGTSRPQLLRIFQTYYRAERVVARPFLRLPSLSRLVLVR